MRKSRFHRPLALTSRVLADAIVGPVRSPANWRVRTESEASTASIRVLSQQISRQPPHAPNGRTFWSWSQWSVFPIHREPRGVALRRGRVFGDRKWRSLEASWRSTERRRRRILLFTSTNLSYSYIYVSEVQFDDFRAPPKERTLRTWGHLKTTFKIVLDFQAGYI